MKDRAKIAAVALAFLALFGFLVFQAGVASRYQPAAAQSAQKSDEGEQGHIEPRSFGNWITHDAAGFFTAWLVIVGFGQAGLFVWQLLYMRQGMKDATMVAQAAQASAETAKEQVALTKMGVIDLERAYLAAGPTNIRKMIVTQLRLEDHGSTWETVVLIHVHNTGRTGATIVKLYGEFSQTPPEGNTPIYENGDWTETDLSIGADKELSLIHI